LYSICHGTRIAVGIHVDSALLSLCRFWLFEVSIEDVQLSTPEIASMIMTPLVQHSWMWGNWLIGTFGLSRGELKMQGAALMR